MQQELLAWYDSNKRTFPWRNDVSPNPYYVWISEIMLQQTTTTTVIPYFNRFIERFPNLQSLKEVHLDDVYHLWQGLGYYSRARNLYKAAQQIDAFPTNKEDWLKLPGVGDYTASAVAAIAYGEKVLPVDGNIRRVMARFYALAYPCGPILQKKILEIVEVKERPGDFCQALMDLANRYCLPKNPKCQECPLVHLCKRRIDLPIKTPKPLKKILYAKAFIMKDSGKIFLSRNQDIALLKGLWSVPLTPFSEIPYAKEDGFKGGVRHIFTHIDLRVDVYEQNIDCDGEWISDLSRIALSKLAVKILEV